MNRKDFIIKGTLATFFAKTILTNTGWAAENVNQGELNTPIDPAALPDLHKSVIEQFYKLLEWMKEKGWGDIVKDSCGIELDAILNATHDLKHPDLFKEFVLKKDGSSGCEDFVGTRLICPGYPAFSFLYHLLASPCVQLKVHTESEYYPDLIQIDLLENVIYGLHPINPQDISDKKYELAVFAYEYRPACKTPHRYHDDLVFARGGFARVGSQGMSYDKKTRCFTNLPKESDKSKEIAVTPARYALFLAESRSMEDVYTAYKMDDDNNKDYNILIPVRKIFDGDLFLKNSKIHFAESHRNEKLSRLCAVKKENDPDQKQFQLPKGFDPLAPPFIRESSSSTSGKEISTVADNSMVSLTKIGSSVLLSSIPEKLVREARQVVKGNLERVRIEIPPLKEGGHLEYTNRRYTSLKVLTKAENNKDAIDILAEHTIFRHDIITNYHVPRNAPMFVNIRERVDKDSGKLLEYLSPLEPSLQDKIDESYWAGLHEDSICDGCITIEGGEIQFSNPPLSLKVLPAFSVVTAPDFFPLTDSDDLDDLEEMFLIGGTEDMGGARFQANPGIHLPGTSDSAFPASGSNVIACDRTIFTTVSNKDKEYSTKVSKSGVDQLRRTNFLPDCATRVFYPGWDITYSGLEDHGRVKETRFYATYGLGSPFLEDSKLCAAVNGMWIAASPDSSRTYRNSLTEVRTGLTTSIFPPTAIPLLDIELGLHTESPAVLHHRQQTTSGWDGEQGPFIFHMNDKVMIDFTDVGRADYVRNALDNKFDMSLLRLVTTAELKFRMRCLQQCYRKVKHLRKHFWLVGFEHVGNWANGAHGYSIPNNLFSGNNLWATTSLIANAQSGYLCLFAKTENDPLPLLNSKRMTQEISELYLFQVSDEGIAVRHLEGSTGWTPR